MKRFWAYIHENSWTVAGIGLVLITLSGPTLHQALWISGVALVLHSYLTFKIGEDNE